MSYKIKLVEQLIKSSSGESFPGCLPCLQRVKPQLAFLWGQAPLGASLTCCSCQISAEAARLGCADRWVFPLRTEVHREDCGSKSNGTYIDLGWVQQSEPWTTLSNGLWELCWEAQGVGQAEGKLEILWSENQPKSITMHNQVHMQSQSWGAA